MSRTRILQVSALAMSGFCLWTVLERRICASEQEPIRIQVVDYPRPVAAAVQQIEKHFGRVVTYEDTRYVHPADIVDVTEQTRRDRSSSRRIFGRRNGSIDLTYTPRPGPVDTQVGEVLQAVIAHSNAAGNAGEFRVDWDPDGYHVVPVAIKGKSGAMEPYASPLDTRITLPNREETGLEMMFRMVKVITTRSGFTVKVGTIPMNRLNQARVTVDAQNDRAREVLWRALQSISPDLSWRLLCSVGERGECALNVHLVRKK